MKNYKRKRRTTKADNETLLLEQIKHLNTLIEKLESKPSTGGNKNKGLKVKIGKLQFTKKEMKEMPRLKDFSIRQKENRVYEIRLTVKNSKLKNYQKNLYRTVSMFPKYKNSIQNYKLEKATLEQLRIEFKRYCPDNTLKDLRHTFTTRARECGIDNELVSVWTGHSLGNITSSVYTHFSIEFQQEQAKKLIYN